MTIIQTEQLSGVSPEYAAVFMNFQTAYRLAEFGFYIFPCQITGENVKAPMPGLPWKSASTRESIRLVRLWAKRGFAAPAIDCGKSGLVVIDPDAKDGKRGVEAWDHLLADHGTVAAPIVSTPSGGRHVYFRQPRHEPIIRCSRGKLPPGIDVKGVGGYVLGPGAIMPLSTRFRRLAHNPRGTQLAAENSATGTAATSARIWLPGRHWLP